MLSCLELVIFQPKSPEGYLLLMWQRNLGPLFLPLAHTEREGFKSQGWAGKLFENSCLFLKSCHIDLRSEEQFSLSQYSLHLIQKRQEVIPLPGALWGVNSPPNPAASVGESPRLLQGSWRIGRHELYR